MSEGKGEGATPGYLAARQGVALFDRSERTRLRVSGRDPRRMLDGILTGTLPGSPQLTADGVLEGLGTYHAVLTPKGKMVTDLWVFLPMAGGSGGPKTGTGDPESFLLDVPPAGREPLMRHLERFLPPRLARVENQSGETAMMAVVGPAAAGALSRLALGLRVDPGVLAELPEGGWRAVASPPGPEGQASDPALMVVRSGAVAPEAYEVIGSARAVEALAARLREAGALDAEPADWETLRVEAGRPEFGVDMTDATIPVEARIHDRAIDYQKGCYTGQEVIVRIRDRGHVNRTLRRLVLGEVPPPEPGTELFMENAPEKPVGWVTSAVRSPAEGGQTVCLAYVRRGTETVKYGGRYIPVG